MVGGMEILVKEFVSELIGRIKRLFQRQKLRRSRIGAAKLFFSGIELIWKIVGSVECRGANTTWAISDSIVNALSNQPKEKARQGGLFPYSTKL